MYAAVAGSAEALGLMPGAPWHFLGGVGESFGSNLSTNISDLYNWSSFPSFGASNGCVATLLLPGSLKVTFPAREVGVSGGALDVWALYYRNATDAFLFTLDIDGELFVLASFTGGLFCALGWSLFGTLETPSLRDSGSILATALGDGGAIFLADNPAANLSMSLFGVFSGGSPGSSGPNWTVGISTCNVAPTALYSSNGASWSVTLGALDGTVAYGSATTVSCDRLGIGALEP